MGTVVLSIENQKVYVDVEEFLLTNLRLLNDFFGKEEMYVSTIDSIKNNEVILFDDDVARDSDEPYFWHPDYDTDDNKLKTYLAHSLLRYCIFSWNSYIQKNSITSIKNELKITYYTGFHFVLYDRDFIVNINQAKCYYSNYLTIFSKTYSRNIRIDTPTDM